MESTLYAHSRKGVRTMENDKEKDQLETTSVIKEGQIEMSRNKRAGDLTDKEVANQLENGPEPTEPTEPVVEEPNAEPAEEPEEEAPAEPVVELTEEETSANVSRLVELGVEVDEAGGMFGIAKSEGLRSGLRTTLLEQAKEAEDLLLKWGQYHEWVSEVIEPALRAHTPKGDDGSVHTKSMGFRLIPETFEPVLGEVVTEGRRPHTTCPHCACEPTGGVVLDLERMRSAKDLMEPIQEKFAVRLTPMIGLGVKGETSPFVKPKRGGGGGGGGGSRESLEDTPGLVEGSKLYRNYSGNLIVATLEKTSEGKLVIRTDKPSKGDNPTNLHNSLSAAAQCYTQVNGKQWWSWEGKPDSYPGSNKDLPKANEVAA